MTATKLNPDGTIDISIGETSVSMTAEELDRHLEVLARARAKMNEKIPGVPPQIVNIVANPPYTVRTDNLTKASLLRIRHPGFGWMNFEIPPHQAVEMKNMWKTIVDKLELDSHSELNDRPEYAGTTLH